ncbi:TonB-dependent receptor domain-containing protein [Adhaeribacter rhizoryzae]|uniref:TonB-dependent receptor n=1 Tax=Adhaeribacter rhizoryzae TaxID=2607907 RepID=A0A5M6DJN0_9BACT|nr:TonB-dependent receptor [Adhaeribacter rhizoryzae]KAA5547767.1 TonB-dependent receptor [Adhaeribacter rhizoryzae]
MKKSFTILLLFLLPMLVLGQVGNIGKISCSVTDSVSAKAVPYVTVTLKDGTKILTGTTADGNGNFLLSDLPLGKFTLELSFIGYSTKKLPVNLTANNPALQLKNFKLSPEAKMLGAVEVTGQKALVEDKGDRLVYNAEKDISNAGGTAADVLRKVPTLTVDLDGNVQMRGNSNIKVLVNGKPSAMMARNLADALRQMPANVIKSVEIITNPGAKFDAEGSAGVINIITKKGMQGFSGTTTVTAGNYNRSLGTSLNYNKKKISFALKATGYQNRNRREHTLTRTTLQNGSPLNILYQRNQADNIATGGYGEMSLDYDLDSLSRLNFAANVWGGNFPSDNTMQSTLFNPAGNQLAAFRNNSRFYNPYGNGQLDLGYTKNFKQKDREFSLLGQFSRMPDNYFYETDTYSSTNEITFRQHSSNYSRNKEYTMQTDYTHPFKIYGRRDTTNLKLEIGLKTIRRDIGSEYEVKEAAGGDGELLFNPNLSNEFDYFQRVYSGYASLRLESRKKWSLNAGARLEQTNIEGRFLNDVDIESNIKDHYQNLIPSITLSKGIKNHTVKISYTQRIQRPLVWFLNPWVNRTDTLNLITGNPYLNPELNHASELAYNLNTKKGLSVNSALYWNYTDNAIEYLATVNTEGVSVNQPQNIAQRNIYGLNLNASGQPNKNWNLSGGINLRHVALTSTGLNQQNSGWVWNLNTNTSYKLPKNYAVQANGFFSSGWIGLQGRNSGFYWHSLALKKEFWDKKASLNLGLNNPFVRGVRQTREQAAPTFYADNRSLFFNRSVRLTFEWRFGQMTAGGKQSKKITNDDKGDR